MFQLANQSGVDCKYIADYMERKNEIRAAIAKEVGISIENTKKCMIALMYGAKTTEWRKNAIPELIGPDAASKLYKVQLFANISKDVKVAGKAILEEVEPNRQGGIKNAFGKSIQSKNGKGTAQILAHLLQGIEALALRACVEVSPEAVVLLQHDGFTTTRKLDIQAIENAMKKATGFNLKLEEEPIIHKF
jgi:hypothetical protein